MANKAKVELIKRVNDKKSKAITINIKSLQFNIAYNTEKINSDKEKLEVQIAELLKLNPQYIDTEIKRLIDEERNAELAWLALAIRKPGETFAFIDDNAEEGWELTFDFSEDHEGDEALLTLCESMGLIEQNVYEKAIYIEDHDYESVSVLIQEDDLTFACDLLTVDSIEEWAQSSRQIIAPNKAICELIRTSLEKHGVLESSREDVTQKSSHVEKFDIECATIDEFGAWVHICDECASKLSAQGIPIDYNEDQGVCGIKECKNLAQNLISLNFKK